MRRVVITGLGLVSPVGCGVEAAWSNLLAGQSGARRVEEFEVSDITCQIANFIPRGATADGKFNPDDWMEPKEQRKVDDFIIYAVAAADQAIADSGLKFETAETQERAGVLIGSGIGGLSGIADTSILLKEKGPRRVSPFFIPGRLINLASRLRLDQASAQGPEQRRRHGLRHRHARDRRCRTDYRARRCRRHGRGRYRKPDLPDRDGGLCRLPRALDRLQRYADQGVASVRQGPRRVRDGRGRRRRRARRAIEHAKARGAKIYAEVIGYGMSADAYHITAPAEDGDGAFRCMKAALARAAVAPSEIDYINAHGTSTPMGDEIELKAVERLFGNSRRQARDVVDEIGDRASARRRRAPSRPFSRCSPCATTLRRRRSISTIRRSRPRSTSSPHTPKKREINMVLSNSFGFGGTNAWLVLRRVA